MPIIEVLRSVLARFVLATLRATIFHTVNCGIGLDTVIDHLLDASDGVFTYLAGIHHGRELVLMVFGVQSEHQGRFPTTQHVPNVSMIHRDPTVKQSDLWQHESQFEGYVNLSFSLVSELDLRTQ